MRGIEVVFKKEHTGSGHSTEWTIYKENNKLYIDGHSGWIVQAWLEEGQLKTSEIVPIPKYIKKEAIKALKAINTNNTI
jgi:hypothetical protein